MGKKTQLEFIARALPVGKRIGFNVSPRHAEMFEEIAVEFDVTNKDLFVAMVEHFYLDTFGKLPDFTAFQRRRTK
jgi:hypothetical protein